MWTNAGRALRALRLQRGWPQAVLGERAGLSRETISRLERGELAGLTLASVDRIAHALGASVQVVVRWQGEGLDRLLDAAHAALQQDAASMLRTRGWEVRVEVSFNHFGDRGRVDLLACHRGQGILLVIEVKSALGDLQETLGRLDVKVRLGRQIARDVGWSHVTGVVPGLVIGDTRAARRAVAGHDALFARYALRGRSALAWVRRPSEPMPAGLLWFAKLPDSRQWTIGRRSRAAKRSVSRGE